MSTPMACRDRSSYSISHRRTRNRA